MLLKKLILSRFGSPGMFKTRLRVGENHFGSRLDLEAFVRPHGSSASWMRKNMLIYCTFSFVLPRPAPAFCFSTFPSVQDLYTHKFSRLESGVAKLASFIKRKLKMIIKWLYSQVVQTRILFSKNDLANSIKEID